MAAAETIVYKGIRYRRYPDAGTWTERSYYVPGIADRQKPGLGRLHEEVWKDTHGPIPPGCHVHHEDHNPLNNDPGNLVCLDGAEHKRYHASMANYTTREWLAHLERIRPLTVAWHRSAKGREWHRQHALTVMAAREPGAAICQQCGNGYETTARGTWFKFCSNRCRSAWRRGTGVDDEQRSCARCAAIFYVNRYAKTRYCGKPCAAAARWEHRKAAGLRSDS